MPMFFSEFADYINFFWVVKHILILNFKMFKGFIMLLNCLLLPLLPDFIQTPLEHSFCAWFHNGRREQNGEGRL